VQEFNLSLRFYGKGRSGAGSLGFGGFGNILSVATVFASSTALGRSAIGAQVTAGDGIKASMSAAGVELGVAI
jgi:hypothetical protein